MVMEELHVSFCISVSMAGACHVKQIRSLQGAGVPKTLPPHDSRREERASHPTSLCLSKVSATSITSLVTFVRLVARFVSLCVCCAVWFVLVLVFVLLFGCCFVFVSV